jgi:restriction system protein
LEDFFPAAEKSGMLCGLWRFCMTPEEMTHNLIGGLLKQYWWVFPLMIFFSLLKLFMPMIKGRIGEGLVNLAAKLHLDPELYRLIKDVTVPTKTGTTQIDHVVVSKFGLFVIETKNYKGWIYADAKDAQWTQVNFKQKHRFQNPLRQNYAHICALSELLDLPKEKIIGVVCFMGDAKFKTGVPEGVFLEGRYVNHILSFKTPVFSESEVANLIQRIESGRLERGFKTNRSHVKHLDARHSPSKNDFALNDSAKKTCPACGAEMVLRTAKKGAKTGNQFWGCSKYPVCKKTAKTASALV